MDESDGAFIQEQQDQRGRWYGKYRGFVVDNDDPDHRGRLRVRIPAVLGNAVTGWALPCLPLGGRPGLGAFWLPDVGAALWVEFEAGDIDHPIWSGTLWPETVSAPEDAQGRPAMRLIVTKAGHSLELDDTEGEEQVRLRHREGTELVVDPEGAMTLSDARGNRLAFDPDPNGATVTLEDANGNKLVLAQAGVTVEDAHGNRVETSAAGLTVKGQIVTVKAQQVALGGAGGEPLIKGTSFLSLFATHIHPTAWGPSGPPIPQGEVGTLSTTTTTG